MAKKEDAFIKIPEKWFILTSKDNIKLNYGALIVLAKIDSLINKQYPSCIASNEYFADLIKVSVRTISDHISRLQSYGIITVEMKKGDERDHSLYKCKS